MQDKHEVEPLTFGFDIGIASVGWCVLGEHRIVGLGVRCFDPGEDTDGKPHNQARRGARVVRNRLRMRRWRLNQMLRLFCDVGMIAAPDPHLLRSPPRAKKGQDAGPWQLRAQGLERQLEPIEWARVLYHLIKYRGFEFFRRSDFNKAPVTETHQTESNKVPEPPQTKASLEESAAYNEKQKLNKALEDTSKLLEKYRKPLEDYRGNPLTIGAMAIWLSSEGYAPGEPRPSDDDRQPFLEGTFRNKERSYRHAFLRAALRRELEELFAAQIKHQNPFTNLVVPADGDYLRVMMSPRCKRLSPSQTIPVGGESREIGRTFRDAVLDLFDIQHPPLYGDQIRDMVGECELVKGQPRASKNAFSAERATWLEKLNHLRIRRNGPETLSAQERACLVGLPYENRVVTLKLVREALMNHTGFPVSWQEASFNVATYQAKPASDGAWIDIVRHGAEPIGLVKWADSKERKKSLAEAKKTLTGGIVTFKQLREQLGLSDSDRFVYRIKETRIVPRDRESAEHILFAPQGTGLCAPGQYFRYVRGNGNPKSLPKSAWRLLATLRSHSAVTLADWRTVLAELEDMSGVWQFERSTELEHTVEAEDEERTTVPLRYEDPQAVEADHKLVELKGWHALRLALAEKCPGRWAQLQSAYKSPASEAGQEAAKDLDEIATILTECQTDHEISEKLCNRGFTDSEIEALQSSTSFSKFRNLSFVALRMILPHLEDGHGYSKSCELANLPHSQNNAGERQYILPPLETYVYQRHRHGQPTGHVENRYKELRNPVVARSFNQARLVFNALVEKHGSPAYVHVETARDLARSKRLRMEIQREQEANRKRIEIVRNDLRVRLGRLPSATQLVKARLYGEQAGQCIYTGKALDFDEILRDEECVEIDHIWPRSKTFDNSLDNRVLVKAGANRDKGAQIPYEFFDGVSNSPRWREFEKRVLACKGLSADKQRRLLSRNIEDADEFLARNLVDTRYVTRMFANMLRERVLFSGAPSPNELEPISPDDDGTTRLNRYQRARVRCPQGRLVDFLRGKWGLAHAKDRESSDQHHALDACIIAACTPKVIQRVNSYFAQEEKEPNCHRFKRNSDGTYTQRTGNEAGEIISKAEARERGLYLPAPWENFHRDLLQALDTAFVSRRPKRKSAGELHDANPKGIRFLPVPLIELTEDMLTNDRLREIKGRRRKNYEVLRSALAAAGGNAKTAFANGYEVWGTNDKPKLVESIALPLWSLPGDYLQARKKALAHTNKKNRTEGIAEANENIFSKSRVSITARKATHLTELSPTRLTEAELGSEFYRRNRELIDALKGRLVECGNDPKKAFAEPFRPPSSKSGKKRPLIRSIRLPEAHGSGMLVRGGITGLGDSIATEVYLTESGYFFRSRYQARKEVTFGIAEPPAGAIHQFILRIDEPIEVILNDEKNTVVPGNGFPGYFVGYESDGRITIRVHDRPGKSRRKKSKDDLQQEETDGRQKRDEQRVEEERDKSLFRFSISTIKDLKRFEVDVLGNFKELHSHFKRGLA